MEFGLHPQEFLFLGFQHTLHGDAGPFGHHFCNVFRRNSLCDNGFLDGFGLGGELVDALLGVGNLAVADFRHLGIVSCALGGLCLDAQLLKLLAGGLEPFQNLFFGVPALHEDVTLALKVLQFGLQFFHFSRCPLTLNSLTLNFFLPYGRI